MDIKIVRKTARERMPVYAGRGAGFHDDAKYNRTEKYPPDYLVEEDDDIVDIWDKPLPFESTSA